MSARVSPSSRAARSDEASSASAFFPFIAKKYPPTLRSGAHISISTGRAATARAVTKSNVPKSPFASSARAHTEVRLVIPALAALSSIKRHFFAVESSAHTEISPSAAAMGRAGKPPPLPTSQSVSLRSAPEESPSAPSPRAASAYLATASAQQSESMMCFTRIPSPSDIAVTLIGEFSIAREIASALSASAG